MEPHPKLFRQQIFAPDTVAAKSRFWKFLSYYQKINKKVGEVVECEEVHQTHPGCAKNFGIWIRYDSRSTSENMYREYRDTCLGGAVTQMYREMAARHRARPGSIQVLKTKRVSSKECRRPQNKAMHDPNIKFALPRRMPSKARALDDSALSDLTPSFKQYSANGCPRHFNFCNTREYVWFMNVLLNLF